MRHTVDGMRAKKESYDEHLQERFLKECEQVTGVSTPTADKSEL